jgi:hypothetical protein
MESLVGRDPTEPGLRFQLADVLFKAGSIVEGREQSRQAYALDSGPAPLERKLTADQRKQLMLWLDESPRPQAR